MRAPVHIWCVGLCRGKGKHTYRVFDDFDEAERFAAAQLEQPGLKVFFWEL